MKKTVWLLFTLLCALQLNAQMLYPEVMSCFGGAAQNSAVHLTFTAGEPLYTTEQNHNAILTQGFNQSVFVSTQTTGIEEVTGYTINVFPNPTQSQIHLQWQTEKATELSLQLTDMNGKTLLKRNTTDTNEQIDLSKFANGMYILQVMDKQTVIKTFKVQKIR